MGTAAPLEERSCASTSSAHAFQHGQDLRGPGGALDLPGGVQHTPPAEDHDDGGSLGSGFVSVVRSDEVLRRSVATTRADARMLSKVSSMLRARRTASGWLIFSDWGGGSTGVAGMGLQ